MNDTRDCIYNFIHGREWDYLKSEDEEGLLKKAKNGDKEARDKIFYSVFLFVIKQVTEKNRKNARRSPELWADLLMVGAEAVMVAINKYDEKKLKASGGTRFFTFASLLVQQKLVRYIDTLGRLSYGSETLRTRKLMLSEIKDGTKEEIKKVAEKYNVRESTVKKLYIGLSLYQSFDVVPRETLFANNDKQTDFEEIEKRFDFKKAWKLIETICTEKEKKLLVLNFGLFGNESAPIETVAKALEISTKTAYLWRTKVLQKIARKMRINED